MSAFAVVYERSDVMGDTAVFNKVMERLSHRGPDGRDIFVSDQVAMGHWHFWTTQEEVGECQPLALDGFPFRIVLDGRIDNREELFGRLNILPAEGRSLSDTALVLRAYINWGRDCFKYFIGEFALVIFDEKKNELICVRDQLGCRTLFHTLCGTKFIVASEPWAVSGARDGQTEINQSGVSHFFALKAPEDGQTLFQDVYELLPARCLVVNTTDQHVRHYWQPTSSTRLRLKSDEEYADRFRFLLEESIRCRLRSVTPVGVLMSGGLDSTTIACITAPLLAPQPLTTISCVFNELPDCDERQYIDAVTARWATHSIQIPCDDAWPLHNWQEWPLNPNYPSGNAYRLVRERAYQRTQQEGLRVLLTGDFGDHLYSGADDWLADLLIEGRFREAGQELLQYLRSHGIRQTMKARFMRRVLRRVFDLLPGGKYLRHTRFIPSGWLTSLAVNDLTHQAEDKAASERNVSLFGALTAQGSPMEIFNASRYAIDLRYPCRDLRLVEFMLTLPAHQLYRHGLYRHILRNATRDFLPEKISTRSGKTTWISLFCLGLEREKDTLRNCIQDLNASWRRFVRPDWVLKCWTTVFAQDQAGADKMVFWLCISFEAWHNYHMPSVSHNSMPETN